MTQLSVCEIFTIHVNGGNAEVFEYEVTYVNGRFYMQVPYLEYATTSSPNFAYRQAIEQACYKIKSINAGQTMYLQQIATGKDTVVKQGILYELMVFAFPDNVFD